jgi:hypothetical protein
LWFPGFQAEMRKLIKKNPVDLNGFTKRTDRYLFPALQTRNWSRLNSPHFGTTPKRLLDHFFFCFGIDADIRLNIASDRYADNAATRSRIIKSETDLCNIRSLVNSLYKTL